MLALIASEGNNAQRKIMLCADFQAVQPWILRMLLCFALMQKTSSRKFRVAAMH